MGPFGRGGAACGAGTEVIAEVVEEGVLRVKKDREEPEGEPPMGMCAGRGGVGGVGLRDGEEDGSEKQQRHCRQGEDAGHGRGAIATEGGF